MEHHPRGRRRALTDGNAGPHASDDLPQPPRARLRGFQRALPISLLRAREATMKKFRQHVASYGLTLQQWRVIRALADEEGLDSKTLSERCVILSPSLTRIFRALSARGLIETVDSDDGRRHCYRLTAAGRALYDEASVESERIYGRIEAAFGSENMAELLRLLDLLRETADALPAVTSARGRSRPDASS